MSGFWPSQESLFICGTLSPGIAVGIIRAYGVQDARGGGIAGILVSIGAGVGQRRKNPL